MESLRPEDRIILSHDGDYHRLRQFNREFSGKIHAIKLGASFLWAPKARLIHKLLQLQGVDMILDAKLEEEPDQMQDTVTTFLGHGIKPNFRKLTVSGMAPVDSLVVAQEVSGDSKIVISLPESTSPFFSLVLNNIEQANNKLQQPIETAMCNAHDIKQVKNLGIVTVIATGIRMPGQNPDDHTGVMTPFAAIEAGADYLNIGRAVNFSDDRAAELDKVLANMPGNR